MCKWTVRDRHGREIYLTEERWKHIIEWHDELDGRLDDVLNTLKRGQRKQEAEDMKEKPDWLLEYEETLDDGQTVLYHYDKEGDILEIFFQKGGGCGVELTDEIVLRYDVKTGEPLSLIFLCFSALMRPTELGPLSFRLKLEDMPDDVRQTVLKIITMQPVNRFLKVLTYSPPRAKQPVPITYVEKLPILAMAQR